MIGKIDGHCLRHSVENDIVRQTLKMNRHGTPKRYRLEKNICMKSAPKIYLDRIDEAE